MKNAQLALALAATSVVLTACGTTTSPLATRPTGVALASTAAPTPEAARAWVEGQLAANGPAAGASTRHLLGLTSALAPFLPFLLDQLNLPTPAGPSVAAMLASSRYGKELTASGYVGLNDLREALAGDRPIDLPRHLGFAGWGVEQHLGPDGTGGMRYQGAGDDGVPGGHKFSDYYGNNGKGLLASYRVMVAGPYWEAEQAVVDPSVGFGHYDVRWSDETGFHQVQR